MEADDRIRFDAALARFLEGEPEPDDGRLIAQAAQQDPARLRQIADLLEVDALLRQHAEPQTSAFIEAFSEGLQASSSGERFIDHVSRALDGRCAIRRDRAWLPWTLAAAAVLAAVLGWGRLLLPASGSAIAPVAAHGAPAGATLALLVNEAGARFAAGAAPHAVSFGAGSYAMTEGVAHVRFCNGADVVLVAPARFTITDALHVRLEDGSLRALVPPSAHGFIVDTHQVRFRDLGTEFGVTAHADGSVSDLHVFAGQVEVYRGPAGDPVATLGGGESARYVQGIAQPLAAARAEDYPTAESIALTRWNGQCQRLAQDQDLVFFHPFTPVPGDPGVLDDRARHGADVAGRISGARWVAGRWPGKQALQFESPGDRVELTIPGEYTAATFAAWIKIDRIEHAANALLNSVGWRPGDIQLQFDRFGHLAPTALYAAPKRRVLWSALALPTGRWVHCATTMDCASGRLRHYLNGTLAGESSVPAGATRISPGACTVGTWIADNKTQEDRDFRGRIDELMMWRVVLPPERIAQLAQEGMPIELPAAGPVAAFSPHRSP